MAFQLKNLMLDPLKGGSHEEITVPEWDDTTVIVRAPSAGDYAAWRLAIRRAAAIEEGEEEAAVQAKIQQADLSLASAQLLVRVVYERRGKTDKASVVRVLTDEDIPALAASWTPVHERLLEKALSLTGIGSEAEAKNSSAESPTSAS